MRPATGTAGQDRDLQAALADPSHRLADAIGQLTRVLRRSYSDAEGLSPTLLTVLGTLYRGGEQRPSDLAESAGLGAPAVTRAVAALQARGLVRRTADPADRRAALVALTPRGGEVLTRIIQRRAAMIAERRERLTAREQRTLDAAIPLLARLAED